MHRKLTITVDEEVYEGLYKVVGRGKISRFLSDLARPHVVDEALDDAYRAMGEDEAREAEALEWSESLITDSADTR
jgi:predicted CopG family antitoxin